MKLLNLLYLLNIYKCIHYIINNKLSKNNFILSPYLFIKDTEKINILFWDKYKENSLKVFFKIKCKENIKYIKRTKNEFFLDNKIISLKTNKGIFNLIKFDTKKLYYKIHYGEFFEIDFKCDLKYLEFIYEGVSFKKDTKITNLQIFDKTEKNYEDRYWDFLNPIIFVNFREENINTKIFTNKFNSYHGGINGSNNNYSKIISSYDKEVGINWILYNKNQYIKLDNKIFFNLNERIIKSFSFYLNFDIINKFLDKNDIKNNNIIIPFYTIYSLNYKILNLYLRIVIKNDEFILLFSDLNYFNIYIKRINIKDEKNNKIYKQKQINKNDLGIKFFLFRHYEKEFNKYIIGFKKNSNFLNNDNTIYELENKNLILFQIKNYKNLKHFIGENNNGTNININKNMLTYFIINEYAIFSGCDFDEIKNINNDIFLKIEGNNNILITNNINLDRKFNLYNNNKISKCSTYKCILCDKNEKCLFCYYNYFLDNSNNCILNKDKEKFVNEYSELIEKIEEIDNDELITNNDKKSLNEPNSQIDLSDSIFHYNINIITSNKFNLLNYKLNDLIYNFIFDNNYYLPISIINYDKNLKFKNYTFEIKNNKNYKMNIKINKIKINCNNLENEIFYNNIDCNKICSINLTKYFYKPINNKKGKCIKTFDNGFFLDENNIIIKCPNNCSNCEFNNLLKKIICNKCIKGFKLINNACIFNNEFNCGKIRNINQIFDNNNANNIKICGEFCNLCRYKQGLKCSLINFNKCDIKNIKIIKANNLLIKKNIERCKKIENNECVKCKIKYFLNDINICVNCKNNSLKCDNSFNCNNCKIGYFLENDDCLLCNLKFKNCLECNNEKCLKFKTKFLKIDVNLKNKFLYLFKDKEIKCKTKENYYSSKNKCLNCSKCEYCKKDSKQICPNCKKCKDNFKFVYIQNKKEINIFYNRNIVNLNKNSLNLKLISLKKFTIIFKKNIINIKIFDNEIKDCKIIIRKKIIKNLKQGNFNDQIIKLKDYNNIKIKSKKNNENFKSKTNYFYFPKININNKIISNSIKITYNAINYSRFSTLFMAFILLLNETNLIILLNTKFNQNFINLLKLVKKNNIKFIKNESIISSKEFKESYKKIKKLYKNNLIIGEMNLIDIDIIIVFLWILIYFFLKYLFNNIIKNNNKILSFIRKYLVLLKVFSFTIFQSYLIKNYYKIIFFIEIFFDLKNFLLKIYWFLFIQFYIILILYLLNKNYFYCRLFINPLFNQKSYFDEYKMIKLFVSFKKKETRNFNLYINIIDFFMVLFYMKLKNTFIIQIIFIIGTLLIKLIYTTILFLKYKKNKIWTQNLSYIFLLNFYLLILFNHYSLIVNEIYYLIIFYFIFINIWEIIRSFIYHILKFFGFLINQKKLKYKKIFQKYSINKIYDFKKSINFKWNN